MRGTMGIDSDKSTRSESYGFGGQVGTRPSNGTGMGSRAGGGVR